MCFSFVLSYTVIFGFIYFSLSIWLSTYYTHTQSETVTLSFSPLFAVLYLNIPFGDLRKMREWERKSKKEWMKAVARVWAEAQIDDSNKK